MVDVAAVAWSLTALFVVVAGVHVHAAVRRGRGVGLRRTVDDALHVLMAIAMIAMLWPWGTAVPVMVYVLVFTAAALWFVAGALFTVPPGTVGSGPAPAGAGHHGSWGSSWHHAAMMASMVFMAVVMSVSMPVDPLSATVSTASEGGTAMAGMDMTGMDMTGVAMGASAGAGGPAAAALWIRVPAVVLALAFVVAALRLVVAAWRGSRRASPAVGAAGGLMAVGMAAVFARMV